MNAAEFPRMRSRSERTSPPDGRVAWSPVKSLRFSGHALVALLGAVLFFRIDAILITLIFTTGPLCLGHSIGLHRLLIRRSFECPRWPEHFLPHLGLLTRGESWHNNHHAFPGSARLGLTRSQIDPRWAVLCGFRALGLVWNLRLPSDLPLRPDLTRLDPGGVGEITNRKIETQPTHS